MKLMPGAAAAVTAVSRLGIPVVVCTKRPVDVCDATKAALRRNGVPFDLLILSHQKVELALALSCALSVEDNPAYAQEFAEAGIVSLLLDASYNRNAEGEGVVRIFELQEVINAVKIVKFVESRISRSLAKRRAALLLLLGAAPYIFLSFCSRRRRMRFM